MRKLWIVLGIVIAACAVVAVLVVVILWYLRPSAASVEARDAGPRATEVVAAALPQANPAKTGAGIVDAASASWITSVSDATGISQVAVRAYAGATLSVAAENPKCGLAWNTLAGIGWVESRHGQIHGRTLTGSGQVTPPLYGVALDGNGFALIPDSDGGAIDGDTLGDRAVGPLQFLPGSWRNWHVDASGDGVEDVQNIYDASLAAAHYLCRAGGDLHGQAGWRTAVLAYNSSTVYLQDVLDAANSYAEEVAPQ